MDVFRWIQQTPLSVYMREDFSAYFIALIFHAWGMALLVGGGIAVSLGVLGVAARSRIEKFAGFFPVMWIGAAMAVLSGLALLAGYPAKALTNWVFALKFACLISASLLVWRMARDIFPIAARDEALPPRARWMAGGALLLWAGGVACGKLLLYTNVMLLVR
jgi:hypothetical protein